MARDARDRAERSSDCDTFCPGEKCELSTNVKMLNSRKQRGTRRQQDVQKVRPDLLETTKWVINFLEDILNQCWLFAVNCKL